ncbi:MAG: hypothetical protein L6Q76_28385 [Polyangiaceae bacterium]|nr:hypothetical protein [Polyangiaceae bacterium]
MTIMRLGQPPPPPTPVTAVTPGGGLIPGLPPDLAKLGEQIAQGAQSILPPGLIPPGLIPGQPGGTTTTMPQQAPVDMFKAWAVIGQRMPVTDEETREEILDIFGDEDSFQSERGNCFSPGMGISISRGGAAPVDLMVSLSCSQAQGDGFQWPYKVNGLTSDTSSRLAKIFEKFFGPVPPGA